jgi:hypothetical protein
MVMLIRSEKGHREFPAAFLDPRRSGVPPGAQAFLTLGALAAVTLGAVTVGALGAVIVRALGAVTLGALGAAAAAIYAAGSDTLLQFLQFQI